MSPWNRRILPLLLLLMGCAPTTPAASTGVQPDPRVTRTPEECSALVERVRAHPDSFAPGAPLQRKFVFPPLQGLPRGWEGRRIEARLFVDLDGTVITDSTRIVPALPTGGYDREFRAGLARATFFPAVLEGCAVPGWAKIVITLPNSSAR